MMQLLKLYSTRVPICSLMIVVICCTLEVQCQSTVQSNTWSRWSGRSQSSKQIIPKKIQEQIDASAAEQCKLTIYGIPSDVPRKLHIIYKQDCQELGIKVDVPYKSTQMIPRKHKRISRSIRENSRRLQRVPKRYSKKVSKKTSIERFLEKNPNISSKRKLAKGQIEEITPMVHPVVQSESSPSVAVRKRMSPYNPADSSNDHCLARRLRNKSQKWICGHYSSGEMGTIMYSELCHFDQEMLRNTELPIFQEALETCCAGAGNAFKNCPSDSPERQLLVLAMYLLTF